MTGVNPEPLVVRPEGRWYRAPLGIGAAIGVAVALTGEALLWVFLLVGVSVLRFGLTAPRTLVISLVVGVVGLPDFMGWYVSGLGLLNLPRIVNYAAAGAVAGLLLGERRGLVVLPTQGILGSRLARYALMLVAASWLLVIAAGILQGPATGMRAINSIVYQVVPLWIGWRLVGDEEGLELVAVVLALSLLALLPIWMFEILAGRSLFAEYVPPVGGGLADSRVPLIRGGQIRAEAVFGHPLNFGQYLLIAVPVAGALAWSSRWRILGVASLVAGFGGLLAARSRSPWLALVAGAIVWAWFKRPRAVTAIIGLGTVALVTAPVAREWVWDTVVVSPFRSSDSGEGLLFSEGTEQRFSAVARVFVVRSSIEAIQTRPLQGYGIGRIIDVAGIPTIDNYPLRVAVESGIPAAVTLFIGLAGMLAFVCRQAPTRERGALLYAAAQVALLAYAAEWALVGQRQTLPIFLVLLGVTLALPRSHASHSVTQ